MCDSSESMMSQYRFDKSSIDVCASLDDSDLADYAKRIIALRQSIDNIDNAVIYLLAERFALTKRIGCIKAQAGFAPCDSNRENEQIARLCSIAQDAGLEQQVAREYHKFVVSESKKRHKLIADRSEYAH